MYSMEVLSCEVVLLVHVAHSIAITTMSVFPNRMACKADVGQEILISVVWQTCSYTLK